MQDTFTFINVQVLQDLIQALKSDLKVSCIYVKPREMISSRMNGTLNVTVLMEATHFHAN